MKRREGEEVKRRERKEKMWREGKGRGRCGEKGSEGKEKM